MAASGKKVVVAVLSLVGFCHCFFGGGISFVFEKGCARRSEDVFVVFVGCVEVMRVFFFFFACLPWWAVSSERDGGDRNRGEGKNNALMAVDEWPLAPRLLRGVWLVWLRRREGRRLDGFFSRGLDGV